MIKWEQFTVGNGAITDLTELMFTAGFQDVALEETCTTRTEVEDGKKLGYVDSMEDVGTPASGCDPEYTKVQINGIEKTWDLGDWEVAKDMCYKDIEDTIGKKALKTGTDVANLEDTPYWDIILMPLLEKAMREMYFRLAWFGDKEAKDVANGGVITDGVNVDLLTAVDGFWKRLFAITAADPSKRTEVTANAETSINDQKQAMKAAGYAVQLFDDLLSDADSRIFDDPDACVMCTNSMFKALRNDLVDKYGKYTMPVEQVCAGVQVSQYDGVKLLVLDKWDRMIKKYETITRTTGASGSEVTKTFLNNPHRALVCSPNNLFLGTEDKDKVASLDVTFDAKERKNYIYATSTLGTLVGEDELVQVAY